MGHYEEQYEESYRREQANVPVSPAPAAKSGVSKVAGPDARFSEVRAKIEAEIAGRGLSSVLAEIVLGRFRA